MQVQRIDINKVTPGAYQSLIQLDKYISETSLSKTLYHLIKVRASLTQLLSPEGDRLDFRLKPTKVVTPIF